MGEAEPSRREPPFTLEVQALYEMVVDFLKRLTELRSRVAEVHVAVEGGGVSLAEYLLQRGAREDEVASPTVGEDKFKYVFRKRAVCVLGRSPRRRSHFHSFPFIFRDAGSGPDAAPPLYRTGCRWWSLGGTGG